MALFRKFFYRKPPDGLLEISERIYVFDSCFTIDEEKDYKIYIGSILGQLREHFLDASFLVFNFHGSEVESEISKVLSEYDVIIMDYPRHYEGCPILSMELIHHFLRSTDSWLALGQQNILLMHCDQGGWPALAFMLAALLIYRKLYTGEQRTLDMVYKQAPRELLRLLSPLNPIPSQIRYLQYVSRRNVVSDWPPSDRALTLDCVIIRHIPDFDGKGGCRPLFRIYGQDPLTDTNQTSKLLFSTPKKSKAVRLYKQAESEIVKIDINCNIQGDIVLECSSLNDDMEHEEMMFRVMFNTSFMRSNILILNRDEVDTLWDAKDYFPKDFRAEVLFSDMDAAASVVAANLSPFEEKEGLPMEAFAKVQEFFSNVDWLDSRADAALDVLHKISASHVFQEKADSPMSQGTRSSSPLQRSSPQMSKEDQKHTAVANDSRSSALLVEDNQLASPNSAMSEKVVSKNSSNVQQEQNQFIPVAESQSNSSSSIKGRTILGSPAMLQSSDTKTSGGIEENNSVLKDPVHSDQTFPAPPPTPISPIPSSFSTSAGKPPTSPLTLVPDHLTSFETPPIRCLDSVVQETGQSSTAMPPSESLTLLPPPPLTADSVDSLSSKAGFPYSLQVPVALPMPQRQDSTSKAGAWPALPLPPTTSQDSGFRAGRPLIPPPPPPPPPTTFRGVSSFRAGPPLPPPSPKQPPTLPLNGNSPIRVVPPPPLPPPLPSNNDSTKVDGPTPPLPPCSIPLPLTTLPLNENSALRAVPSPPPPTPPPLPSSAKVRTPAPPPPPPPQQSMSASLPKSLSPVPPPPLPAPSLVHKHSDSKLQNSSAAPPAPPPPAAFGKGATKAGSAPIPGPPYSSPSNTRARSPLRPLGPRSTQTKKLKPLHWLKLTRAAQGSVWAETQKSGEFSKTPDIDLSELESLFSVAAPNLDRGKSRRGLGGPKSDKVQLIDHRRAYNCEIMLSKVKIPVNELMSSLLSLDDSALDVDQVDNLIKFCPTKEEMELLKGYTGDVDKLGKTEQFLLELMKVPRVQSKLRVFSFKMGFHTQVLDLRNSLSIVNLAVDEIRNSVKLKRILQTILSLGNALNQGTARGSAVGFRLDSLLKLTETRARDNKMTLMHYLCKVVAEKSPELLDFSKELSSMEPASKIQIKFLAEEMQAITKGLEKVVQELSMSEDDGPVSEVFQKNLKEFLHVAEAKVRLLCSLYSAVGKNVDALIIYFGEDPARCQFEQVMSTLFNFTRMFNQAHDENLKQLELEKKKAEKEAAEHQKLASPRSLGHVISSPKTSRMAKYFKSSD